MPKSEVDANRICQQLTGKNPISKGNFMKEKKKERQSEGGIAMVKQNTGFFTYLFHLPLTLL